MPPLFMNQVIQQSKGFTLLEVMVTITILVVLISAGLPQMGAWVESNQMNSRASTIVGLLRAARSEALTRNNTVTLATNGASQDWANVIDMYVDTSGGNDPFNASNGDEFIREVDLSSNNITINGNSTAGRYISFSGDGRLDEDGQTAIIEICNGTNTNNGQTISINIVGRVSVSEGVTDCTP